MGMEETAKVWDRLGLSRDDYMMLYWDIPNRRIMAIPHVGIDHVRVGVIFDLKTDDEGNALSFDFCRDEVQS